MREGERKIIAGQDGEKGKKKRHAGKENKRPVQSWNDGEMEK